MAGYGVAAYGTQPYAAQRAAATSSLTQAAFRFRPDDTLDLNAPFGAVEVLDTFARSVTDGFGSADTGGAYSLVGTATNFDVAGGYGTVSIPANGDYFARLLS